MVPRGWITLYPLMGWVMGCERRVGRRCGVNYFKNKLLFVSGLFFHFLYCLGSCFPGILPAWRYSLGPLMKYSPWLWADMRKVTWKVKRTNHGRRLGDGKFSYQTELFKGWARLNLETVAWRLPVEISQDLRNTVWRDELSSSGGQQSFSAHKTKYFMFDKNSFSMATFQLPARIFVISSKAQTRRKEFSLCLLTLSCLWHIIPKKKNVMMSWP